ATQTVAYGNLNNQNPGATTPRYERQVAGSGTKWRRICPSADGTYVLINSPLAEIMTVGCIRRRAGICCGLGRSAKWNLRQNRTSRRIPRVASDRSPPSLDSMVMHLFSGADTFL